MRTRNPLALSVAPLLVLAYVPVVSADAGQGVAATFKRALEAGDIATPLLMSFAAGLATSLTPCVYPMIAITVSVFGARKVSSRLEGAALSTAFVLGMTTLFTTLGVVAALSGGVFGNELGSPLVAGALALMFGAMALSMFGAFELALPYKWTTWLGDRGGIGFKGAFVLGMVSSLIAAPCVGPVLGLLLPWIGSTGNVAFGAACMVAYALGLGLLFWVVGTFAVGLPKSGRWMEWVKSAFGLVMIGSALYFLRAWLPGYARIDKHSSYLVIGLALLAGGLLLGAVHLSFHEAGVARTRKASGIVLASLGILLTVGWLEARPAHANWEHDLAQAKQRAKDTGAPLLVDFGASWCQACGELERHTFSDPRVVAESLRFVKVKVDLSPGQDVKQGTAWLQGYGARGLPLVILHSSDGREHARVTEFVEADKMLELLRAVD